ncbi:MAG TPA: hypothetical protein VNI52_05095 [Sphingobacteriaceae bacterium]|nr:hypothetical protein [Sphingobacteriaceae bacterium]
MKNIIVILLAILPAIGYSQISKNATKITVANNLSAKENFDLI